MISRLWVRSPGGHGVLLVDSVSFLTPEDEGAIVVCASHGGLSAGEYAATARPSLVILNDAGVGKDDAGIAGIRLLAERGIPAAAVSHHSARIGDVMDHWNAGTISFVNGETGVSIHLGAGVQRAVDAWCAAAATRASGMAD